MDQRPRKLLDQTRDVLREKGYSIHTERSYVDWIRRFILFHDKRHPREMGAPEIGAFLTHLAHGTAHCRFHPAAGPQRPPVSLPRSARPGSRSGDHAPRQASPSPTVRHPHPGRSPAGARDPLRRQPPHRPTALRRRPAPDRSSALACRRRGLRLLPGHRARRARKSRPRDDASPTPRLSSSGAPARRRRVAPLRPGGRLWRGLPSPGHPGRISGCSPRMALAVRLPRFSPLHRLPLSPLALWERCRG